MANNILLNPGTGGDNVRTDDDGTAEWQYVKLAFGADGTRTIVADGTGLPVTPFSAILETGLTELIGEDSTEVTAAGGLSNTADLTITGSGSGEILSFMLASHENGDGAVNTPAGAIMFFDADPNVAAGDVNLAAIGAEHATIIGMTQIQAGEWDSDANGAVVVKTVAIPFHALSTIYAVFRNTDASVTWNNGAANNEVLDINVWYRRDS